MVSDIARKMDDHQLSFYGKDLALFVRVINQERSDKDKVYSLHEPEVQCISKGKEHKKYEFGNKSAIAKTRSGLIVSALAFIGNPYDGHTIYPLTWSRPPDDTKLPQGNLGGCHQYTDVRCCI